MPVKLIKYSFSGGVFSEGLHGRNDLEKYDLGLALAENFFIDYRGGATSRAGFEFEDEAESASIRLFSFMYNTLLANTYLLIFTPLKVRFMQDGAYVLEAAKTISSITGSTVNSTAHGYSAGDLVQIGGRTYLVATAPTNSFTVTDFAGAAATPDDTATSAYRVYTVTTPYTADDLAGLQFRQRQNKIIITSLKYDTRDLVRSGHTSWALSLHDTGGPVIAAPTGLTGTPSAAGTAATTIAVSAVDFDGRETALTYIVQVLNMINYTDDPGSLLIEWNAVAGAKYYNVYRSLVFPTTAQSSLGQQLGYIGRSYTTSFVDVNVTPDFTHTPQQYANPFKSGQVQYIEITAPGSGYTSAPMVSVTGGGGSGFAGVAILDADEVVGVLILNGGSGYSSPVVGFTGGGGSGATATATLNSTSNEMPAVSVFYGQRLWFLGTTGNPMRLYSGRGDDALSFNKGQLATALDPYELDIDSPELTPIRYTETLVDNLFIFTDLGVWQMAPADGGYASTQRTRNGIGVAPPLPIDTELVFVLPNGSGVRALRPGQVPNQFVDADLTIFSGDFFTPEQEIISWAYARTPFRVVWAVLKNGRMLSFTYVPEHNVYAWASHSTQGNFLECAVVNESGIDRLYVAVERDSGVFIERMANRTFTSVEEIWSVDSGLANTLTQPAADLTITVSGDGTTATCVADSGVFSSGDVGAHLRAGGGRGVVTAYTSATQLTIEMIVPIVDRKPQSEDLPLFAEGTWSLTQPSTTFRGFQHLAGKTVQVLGDGSYMGDFIIDSNGVLTVDVAVSRVIGGLGFYGELKTLPPSASDQIIDDLVKRMVGLALRVENTRGLRYGTQDIYYDLRERTDENYGEPTRFQSGLREVSMRADWRTDGQVQIKKVGPSAISLLGYIIDMELGDDQK